METTEFSFQAFTKLIVDKAAPAAVNSAVAALTAGKVSSSPAPAAKPASSAAPAAPPSNTGAALMTKALAGFGAGAGKKPAASAAAVSAPAAQPAPAAVSPPTAAAEGQHTAECKANIVDKGILWNETLDSSSHIDDETQYLIINKKRQSLCSNPC